jgi:hypothetical protein
MFVPTTRASWGNIVTPAFLHATVVVRCDVIDLNVMPECMECRFEDRALFYQMFAVRISCSGWSGGCLTCVCVIQLVTHLGGWWPSRDLTVCMACKTIGCKDGAPSSPPTKAIACPDLIALAPPR